MKNIALFASGSGSNAEKIIHYFQSKKTVLVKFIICNNPKAGVINKAKSLGVSTFVFTPDQLKNTAYLLTFLQSNKIEFIALAGYLRMIPKELIHAYPNAILNIHPALLPNFGGKGMHGHHVHDAVLQSGATQSGITIHYVNEAYDEGQIIFQEKCDVKSNDTSADLALRVLSLEHKHYAPEIEKVVLKNMF